MLVHPEFRKAYEELGDVDLYYSRKYKYLKKYNFFSTPLITNFGTVNESMIKESIVQTPQIVFEVTDFCNLSCLYCGFGELYEGFDVRNTKNINTHNAIKLIKYFFDLKPPNKKKKLTIGFYGGEPLLNVNFIKQIVEVVNRLRDEKEMDIGYNMTTNATLIHKHIHFLVENNFQLLVSLDGNEKNHSYRFFSKNKKNSFERVIENMDMVQKDYPEYFFKYINFNAVLHDRNSVKEIYEFICTRYHKIPRIAQLTPSDVKPSKKDLRDKMFRDKRKSEIEYQKEGSKLLPMIHNQLSGYRELTDFLKYYSVNFYVSNITTLLQNVEKQLPTGTCLPGNKKIFLTTHNKLLPCEKINYKYSIGEVNDNITIDISEITRRYNFYYDYIKKNCQVCYINRYCGECLFLMDNLNKVNTEEFVCEGFHSLNDFKNKLYRIFSFLEKTPNNFSQIIENEVII
jgi:uncharacterized protein